MFTFILIYQAVGILSSRLVPPTPSEKGTPAARLVRNATGLTSETAGLPKKGATGALVPVSPRLNGDAP